LNICVGAKEADFKLIQKGVKTEVEYVLWPNQSSEKSDVLFTQMKGRLASDYCYIHYSGYQKLSCEELNLFDCKCINIHPAPPQYPGVGGINYALYNGDKEFGVTVHLMNEDIDRGLILDVMKFPLPEGESVERANILIASRRIKKLQEVIHEITNSGFHAFCTKQRKHTFKWATNIYKRKDLNLMQVIDFQDLSPEELEKRIKAFHTEAFPLQLRFGNRCFSLIEHINANN
jgi:methionyl-tRNA formyltransferase